MESFTNSKPGSISLQKNLSLSKRDDIANNEIKKNSKAKDIYKLQLKKLKYLQHHYMCIENYEAVADLPEQNEQYRIVTQQQINAFTLILFLVKRLNQIDELYLTIYSLNEKTIIGLFDLMDAGHVNKLVLVIADSFRSMQKERYIQLKKYFDARPNFDITIVFTWNHTKITAAKCQDKYFVIEGSGNFSENARIEQYIFEQNKKSFDFHKAWIENFVIKVSAKYKPHEIWTNATR